MRGIFASTLKLGGRGRNFQNTGDIEVSVYLSDAGSNTTSNIAICITVLRALSASLIVEDAPALRSRRGKAEDALSYAMICYAIIYYNIISYDMLYICIYTYIYIYREREIAPTSHFPRSADFFGLNHYGTGWGNMLVDLLLAAEISIYVYIHIICIYIYICCMYSLFHLYICILYVHIYRYIYTHIYMYIYIYIEREMHLYIYIYIHTYLHTYKRDESL